MITLKNISFSYDENKILENIDIKFEQGKIYTILGVNGSGKTTLLNIIGRLITPASGELFLHDKEYKSFSRREFAKQIAYLPQIRNVPSVSVYELISHGRFPYLGFSRTLTDKDKKIVDNVIKSTKLDKLKNKNLNEISGGERQRAYIGMLLAQSADFLLLDEPTSYLDLSHCFDVLDIIKDMKKDNKCIILVLHDIVSALKISDCFILLDKGNISYFTSPKQLLDSKILEKVFNIECVNIQLSKKDEYIIRKKS